MLSQKNATVKGAILTRDGMRMKSENEAEPADVEAAAEAGTGLQKAEDPSVVIAASTRI